MPIWIIAIQWLSRVVLVVLLVLSVWSVATMIRCARGLKVANGEPHDFNAEMEAVNSIVENKKWKEFQDWAAEGGTLHKGTARAILQTASSDSTQVDRAVKSYLSKERTRLEEGLTVLATLGANAPFIGLFGTVLGIIQAFGAMGAHQNNTADIMVGISEALVATAIGLFVAIPAVVAFNVFSRRLRVLLVNSEALKDLYLSQVKDS